MPCAKCARIGVTCERREGKCPARGRGTRKKARRTNANGNEDEMETDTETGPMSEYPTLQPEVCLSIVKREHKPKESKKWVSNAVTYRGDPNRVWTERPHPQAGKPLCIGTPEVWCTVLCLIPCSQINKTNPPNGRTAKSCVRVCPTFEVTKVEHTILVELCVVTSQMAVRVLETL